MSERFDTAVGDALQGLMLPPSGFRRRSRNIQGTEPVQNLIWIGALVTLVGLAGLIWCILKVQKARRAALDDAAMKAHLQKVVAVNMGALFLSAVGLMMVVVGILLR